MTLTIELPPEVEQQLTARAQEHGQNVQAYVLDLLMREVQNGAQEELSPRQQAARAGYGMLAGRGRSVNDFLRERHEEAAREMQATGRRHDQMKNPEENTQ